MQLRKIRIVLATVVFALITLLFMDHTGTMKWASAFAKLQFVPALLALNVVVVVALLALTLVFGRIYCSVICPLGILQDLLAHLRLKKKKYGYSKELKWLRYPLLAVFAVCLVAGMSFPVSLLEPYSSFGRIAQNIFQPVWILGNNLLALVSEKLDSYAFYSVEPRMAIGVTFFIAVAVFALLLVLAVRGGRTYCNTLCPVGTLLGFFSRFSLLKVVIDADKCKNCHRCEHRCKSACIDLEKHTVDYSRCVACGNCLGECKFDAISYARKSPASKDSEEQGTDVGRRSFMLGTLIAGATAALAQEKKKVDGGLAVIEDKVAPKRKTRILPPGALSASHFQQHCTACQLCVSKCPNNVLRPSTSLDTLMQPYMSYENGYCRPECNNCAEVCPTGAIRPIDLAQKSSTQIGHAVIVKKNCIAISDGISCGNCARHCPAGAIIMVPNILGESRPMIPSINESRCIGCGACENLCPARPFSAIYVEGHETHSEV